MKSALAEASIRMPKSEAREKVAEYLKSDPALLKHIGGDLYAVLATWDLTELERSVLGGRLH